MKDEQPRWSNPDEKEYVKFSIDGNDLFMSREEYDRHILFNETEPVIIGDTLYMVSKEDLEVLEKINKNIPKPKKKKK